MAIRCLFSHKWRQSVIGFEMTCVRCGLARPKVKLYKKVTRLEEEK